MKLLLVLIFSFIVASLGQDDQTVTSGLLASQADLALGHAFFETSLGELE